MKLFMLLFGMLLMVGGYASLFYTLPAGASLAVITSVAGMIIYWEGIKAKY